MSGCNSGGGEDLFVVDVDTWWWRRLAAREHADPAAAGKADLCGTIIMVRKKLSNKFNTNTILRNQLHKLSGNEQTTNKVSFYGDQYTLSISKK